MCIVNSIVDSISTKILAIPSKDGKRQLTVYSNTVSSPDSNIMCIPVPNPYSVQFEHVHNDIFSQCNNSFQDIHYDSNEQSISNGSYKVILVNSIDDLHKHGITPDVITFLTLELPN